MLQLQDICFEVTEQNGTKKQILNNINLTIEDKTFVVITGPNGSGKSTLAKIIMGIETPTSGKILLNGDDITNLDITDRANLGIGFAFQQPVRFKGLTVKDLIGLAARRELNYSEACEYLSEVGLCARDYIDRELNSSLSGGELKRIEIAMLIARNPQVSVFDEPEAGIDLWSFNNLIRVFKHMHSVSDGAITIISHQERILEIADKIVLLAGGEIKQAGKRSDILPQLFQSAETCEFYKGEQN